MEQQNNLNNSNNTYENNENSYENKNTSGSPEHPSQLETAAETAILYDNNFSEPKESTAFHTPSTIASETQEMVEINSNAEAQIAPTPAEIDPIYQEIHPNVATETEKTYGGNVSYPPHPQIYTAGYSHYGSAPEMQQNHPEQSSPYFSAKPMPEKKMPSYQEVKAKRKQKGKAFRTIAACLALIVGFYGTYTLGAYQTEQRMDEKLAEIKAELHNRQLPASETTAPIQSTQSADSESKAAAIPPVISVPGASPVVAIADRVAPSVVTITATVSVRGTNIFFEPQTQTYKGSGSGILYKKENNNLYIITNHHVIENGNDIRVIFYDGENVAAEVVGYDSRNDLAVLKVDLNDVKSQEIDLATFGDSTKLKVGQLAVAIGNPLGEGHDHTITAGVISSVNRTLDIENIKGLEVIQTDAAINPGNSGGALVNEYAEVIGINTAKYLDVKVEGMGFAIPSSVAVPVVEKIMKNGNGDAAYVISDDRPFLGIGFSSITSDIYAKTGVPFGVYVTNVYEGSAAAEAGVEVGDILFSLNGVRIKDANMLFDSIGKLSLGDNVKIGLVRNDKVFEVEATITSFGEVNAQNNNQLNQAPSEKGNE